MKDRIYIKYLLGDSVDAFQRWKIHKQNIQFVLTTPQYLDYQFDYLTLEEVEGKGDLYKVYFKHKDIPFTYEQIEHAKLYSFDYKESLQLVNSNRKESPPFEWKHNNQQ